MSTVLIIFMMVAIGAVIGGVTNSLAIKMLFRPYHARYIGKFKLPFTPGLIPKRKDELAKQLGKMVVEHLITEEGLRKKLVNQDFQTQVEIWLEKEVNKLLVSDNTLRSVAAQFDFILDEVEIKRVLQEKAKGYYDNWMKDNATKLVGEIIDENVQRRLVSYFPMVAEVLQQRGVNYLGSEGATSKMEELVDSYFTEKGFFGNMFASVMGGRTIIDKIQPILTNYVDSQDMKQELEKLLQQEWEFLLEKPIKEVEVIIGKDTVETLIGYTIDQYAPVDNIIDQPFKVWFGSINHLIEQIVTGASTQLMQAANKRIGKLISGLGLEQIVENEVQAFPLERVEQLVLNISRREFKLITYLGALLGGLIGLIQGIIVVLVG
ncbi:UPF0754 membrane protein [Paraliobacillus quinghaiensis]|uniref:UPF0754 membrane protein n=1 Tax=Paraliobacillus quinghaiensis TaxID=470815 RepID=A0A917TJW4_9BACI|nr:DUF445 family protein [Paraliobacillus quinghaiensis]GGM25599.1 UPF0754 membrane protein [Paraliobacillus quinghaiensis]